MITIDQFQTMDKGTMLIHKKENWVNKFPAILYYVAHQQDDTIIVQNRFSNEQHPICFELFGVDWNIATPLEVILYSTKG